MDGTFDGDGAIIQRGDFLWTDFGINYAGMHTDMQHMGYVLDVEAGEISPPEGLVAGLRKTNRMQDLILQEMQQGRTGNEVLAKFVDRMVAEDIDGVMYSHPIGDHGHAAGPIVGLFDLNNKSVPVLGDTTVLRSEMWYAVELCAYANVPEWGGQRVHFRQEENAVIGDSADGSNHFAFRRQEAFHLVV